MKYELLVSAMLHSVLAEIYLIELIVPLVKGVYKGYSSPNIHETAGNGKICNLGKFEPGLAMKDSIFVNVTTSHGCPARN